MNNSTNWGDENPYASPEVDGVESLGEVRHGSPFATQPLSEPFGLIAPLRAEGALSDRDIEEAFEKVSVESRLRMFSVVMWIFSILYLVFILSTVSDTIGFLILMSMLFWSLGGFVFSRMARRFSKTCLRKDFDRAQKHRQIEISESSYQSTSVGNSVEIRWEAFSGYQHSEQIMILDLSTLRDRVIVARTFFSCDEDWETFVGLVCHKLMPLSAKAPIPVATEVFDTLPPIEKNASETDDSEQALCVSGTPTLKDVNRAIRLIPEVRRYHLIGFWGLVILGMIPGVFACFAMGRFVVAPLLTCIPALGLTLLWLVIFPRRNARKQLKTRQGFFRNMRYTFTDKSVRFDISTMRAITDWSEFPKVTRTDTLVLLQLPNAIRVHLILRSYFASESDWRAFLQLLDRKYPK